MFSFGVRRSLLMHRKSNDILPICYIILFLGHFLLDLNLMLISLVYYSTIKALRENFSHLKISFLGMQKSEKTFGYFP